MTTPTPPKRPRGRPRIHDAAPPAPKGKRGAKKKPPEEKHANRVFSATDAQIRRILELTGEQTLTPAVRKLVALAEMAAQ